MKYRKTKQIVVFAALLLISAAARAQTTAFNYQGKLTDAGNPANGSYQMQFRLFDAISGGSQIGATISDVAVTASQGVFAVKLDFGANALNGANRWLEIAVRHNSGESYTTLAPREQIASSPYSVRTLSAQQADLALDANRLGGVLASEYVTTSSVGNSFIKNATSPQQTAGFNINGNGLVGGNLGVGATSPTARLEIFNTTGEGFALTNGTARLRANFTGNTTFFGTSTNTSFGLHANGGINGGLFLENTGNIGIGTIFPNHKLTIDTLGGPNWTTQNWGGAIALRNASAIGWQLNSSNLSFGIGQSTDGLSFFRTTSVPGTTGGAPNYDLQITNAGNVGIGTTLPNAKLFVQGEASNGVGIAVTGNASQSRDKGGWAKALLYINQNGTIARCYNGLTGASTGNCGFSVTRVSSGVYDVNFGFQVDDRFFSLTTFNNLPQDGCNAGWITLDALVGNVARITAACSGGFIDKPVMILVF
jgi:hypothetical protein